MSTIYIKDIGHPDLHSEKTVTVSILIKDGKVEKIYPEGSLGPQKEELGNAKVIDGRGLTILPGLCDAHVHFRDPGFTYKEDIESGARAAAAGGFTEVILMANTKPAVSDAETLSYVLDKASKQKIKIHTCATVTEGIKGEKLVDMAGLKEKGAIGFTDDGIPIMDEKVLAEALKRSEELDAIISLHEEDKSYIKENGINHGMASEHFNCYGSPAEAEFKIIERDIDILRKSGGKMLIQHISTKEGVELVRAARKEGLKVYAEATPHHISFTEETLIECGANAKMNPPLRTEEDRRAIVQGLKDDTISIISTDHAPHAREEKEGDIVKALSGMTGLETSFSLCYENLVLTNEISLYKLIDKMAVMPRKLYDLPVPEVKVGSAADFTIVDLNAGRVFDKTLSKSSNTPLLGKKLKGKIIYTICEGEVVYEDL